MLFQVFQSTYPNNTLVVFNLVWVYTSLIYTSTRLMVSEEKCKRSMWLDWIWKSGIGMQSNRIRILIRFSQNVSIDLTSTVNFFIFWVLKVV